MSHIAKMGEDETVPCASCEAVWNLSYLTEDIGRQRLRANGFAFIWFDDGALCVNQCPHCDQPVKASEAPPWMNLAPSF